MKLHTIAVAIVLAHPALAAEICISCSEPDAVYRCSLEKEKQVRMLYKKDDLYAKVCTTLMPKLGPHKKCVVSNQAPCSGTPKTITLGDALGVFAAQ